MAEFEFPDGGLRLFGLIGDPIAQVRACLPATQAMRQAGAFGPTEPVLVDTDVL